MVQQNQSNGYWAPNPEHPSQKKWFGAGHPTTTPSGLNYAAMAGGPQGRPQTDPYQLPQGSKPQFSTVNGVGMNPGQPQISTVGNPSAADINSYRPLAPGQHPYNGPKIKPMNNQPGKGIGFGGPTVFNQNFAQSPYGQSQMPYQPKPVQWKPPQQQQQWGY